jgi:hypothetical protein
LLDPSIDVSTRVGRSFALRYEGLSQQVKYFKSIHDEALLENANSRINEVEKKACDLGFSKVIDKYGKRNGIAQQMPFITDLIRQTLDEEGTYRLLSAMAHGHNWAVQKLSFRRVASENPIFANDAEVNLFEKNIDPTAILFLCNKAFICHAKSEWFRFQLFGWDQKQLQEIMEITSTSLQINPENHFWEQAN